MKFWSENLKIRDRLQISKRIREDNIKLDLLETVCDEDLDRLKVAQDRN
jgi:hypothetical protein